MLDWIVGTRWLNSWVKRRRFGGWNDLTRVLAVCCSFVGLCRLALTCLSSSMHGRACAWHGLTWLAVANS